MLLTPSEAKAVTDRLLMRSKADHCIVRLNGGERTNLRFARGNATTNGDQSYLRVTVESHFGQRAGAASVSGLDNYRRARSFAVRRGGLTPTDILNFYNLQPLRQAGLDGTGQTIVLPEIDDLPNLSDLNKFATEFSLPPFDSLLTIKRDPSWGSPLKPQGETVLDLEIIHEVAPNAKLVIYLSAADFGHGDRAFDQMVTDHLGSIISESLGACEPDSPSGHRNTYAAIQDRAVAQGMSHFVASGDSGAYTCGEDQGPAGSFPATLPTAAELSAEGATVAEVLKALEAAHPGFAERLFDDHGELRRFVNVFVADEDIRFLDGLSTPVAEGQTVSIIPAVAGG